MSGCCSPLGGPPAPPSGGAGALLAMFRGNDGGSVLNDFLGPNAMAEDASRAVCEVPIPFDYQVLGLAFMGNNLGGGVTGDQQVELFLGGVTTGITLTLPDTQTHAFVAIPAGTVQGAAGDALAVQLIQTNGVGTTYSVSVFGSSR